MIEIKKASAGSGKTHLLTQTYIHLLRERYAYRHILAVTFTNKATAEMKNRILGELARRANDGDAAARETLTDILHDYGAFSVSTIDTFFQRALKAFSREIGHFSAYQIELDRNALTDEAMDRILDGLTEDQTDILGWMRRHVTDELSQGGKIQLEQSLHEMGRRLSSEEFRELAERTGIDPHGAFDKERMQRIKKECHDLIVRFERDLVAAARELEPGITNKTALKSLQAYLEEPKQGEVFPPLKVTLAKESAGSRFADLMERDYTFYRTAFLLRGQMFSLGLAGEFFKSFEELLREKNVLSLDDSNTILRDIIDGSDAPFIYEKLGVRYEHFLLDEFQDTSHIQWENFLPLLRESDASGHESLIVGDVKQSIYRFRNSDWELLARTVNEAFPDAKSEDKRENWRSCRKIVAFNNAFFTETARRMGLEELYSAVEQEVRSRDSQEGGVRISFCDKDEQLDRVLASVREARAAGARFGDIAVLVRNNKEGGSIALHLIKAGIPVISDDSLDVKSSPVVRRLTALLSSLDNPDDGISRFLTETLNVTLPDHYESLYDLCARLLRDLQAQDPASFDGEDLFIQAFLDELQNYIAQNGSRLRDFLSHWKENAFKVSSPPLRDAVRVLTIHKSKGLQFPYLIFPFAEKVTCYDSKNNWHWCHLKTGGTPFCAEAEGLYPVLLSNTTGPNTLFREDYERDLRLQAIDNLNLFYVALTRAEKYLHVIAAEPGATFKKERVCKDLSQYLYLHCGEMDEYVSGQMYDFSRMPGKDGEERPDEAMDGRFTSIPLGGRLTPSTDTEDFFAPDDGHAPGKARREGIILHGILEQVRTAGDLPRAVEDAVQEGLLDQEGGKKALELLSSAIAKHPDWFAKAGRNEVRIIDGNGQEHRPDRVVITPEGRVQIIDYKFGREEESRYRRQVGGYMELYRQMGHADVQGFIWYVREDRVISLSL